MEYPVSGPQGERSARRTRQNRTYKCARADCCLSLSTKPCFGAKFRFVTELYFEIATVAGEIYNTRAQV